MRNRILTCLAAFLLICFTAYGAPARRLVFTLTQPDGTEIQVLVHGDDNCHYMTDLDGHVLKRNQDGFYCYAYFNADGTMRSSGYTAGAEVPGHVLAASSMIPSISLRLRSSERRRELAKFEAGRRELLRKTAATKSGPVEIRNIVIPICFADMDMDHDEKDFDAMINQKGYSVGGSHGSAMDYLKEMYRDDFTFVFDVIDTVRLSRERSYYFSNNDANMDIRPADAVAEACRLADEAGVDFSKYADDGVVNNIIVFCAGKDEAAGGGEDCVWSHQWSLRSARINLVLDGVDINHYLITSELSLIKEGMVNKFEFATIGTLCHEYGHMMGLQDYYDTNDGLGGGYASGMFGTIAIMDSGNYNDNGKLPPHYNAVDYDDLGIGNCEIMKQGEYTLEPISENRRYLKMETGTDGEYFLVECRNNKGWDKLIGGKGLAIYHIDKSTRDAGYSDDQGTNLTAARRWEFNEVNCRPDNQCGYVIPAKHDSHYRNSRGDIINDARVVFFPFGGLYTSVGAKTAHKLKYKDGTPAYFSVENISFDGENVTFFVRDNREEAPAPDIKNTESDIFQDAAIIQWTSTRNDYKGPAVFSWGKSGATPVEVEVEPYSPGKYSITLEGLSPKTAYKTSIFFREGDYTGKTSEVNFTTKSMIEGSYPFIHFQNVTRNEDGSFPKNTEIPLRVYNLSDVDGVTWYFNRSKIETAGNGYYTLTRSGELKADIVYKNGQHEYIVKQITVK
ncbi:MAG: M6 family metalloprotease domain-containing protein [Bacteroidales bacterium]|nr:M6 family metalloprotease domain-containing protein [Bacteroidales bacterium]